MNRSPKTITIKSHLNDGNGNVTKPEEKSGIYFTKFNSLLLLLFQFFCLKISDQYMQKIQSWFSKMLGSDSWLAQSMSWNRLCELGLQHHELERRRDDQRRLKQWLIGQRLVYDKRMGRQPMIRLVRPLETILLLEQRGGCRHTRVTQNQVALQWLRKQRLSWKRRSEIRKRKIWKILSIISMISSQTANTELCAKCLWYLPIWTFWKCLWVAWFWQGTEVLLSIALSEMITFWVERWVYIQNFRAQQF